jgi:hypothetical protein
MSHYQNKQQKRSKIHFQEYLSNTNEPLDDISGDLPAELEAELLGNRKFMRRRFRDIAQRSRERYS